MGDVKQYKYKIDLELGAKDFSPEIAKMFSKVQQQADKEKVVLTLTGDDRDIVKQLTNLKSKIPDLDLSKAITVGFSDALKADGDKAQKYAQNFLTNIVNSVGEALKSIDSIKGRIQSTEKELKSAEGKLDFLGAGDADKALLNLTKRFQGIKAEEKNVDKLKDTFQQIKDIASSTGKEIPEGVKKYQENLKTAFGKDIFKDIKPSKTYEQYFEEASSKVFELRNELFDLKKELETSMNPEIQVKGKLSDNFIGDLQSQLDQMTGIEVKVKPKIDNDVKLEVEVKGNVKPNVQPNEKAELLKSADKIDLGKYDLSKIEVVNEKLSEYKSEAESISESAQKAVDELNKFTGKSYTLDRNMSDIPSTLRQWNKASMSANDFKKEIKAAIEANEKEKAAILYENLKTYYPKSSATLDTFKDKDFKDNYNTYLSQGKTKEQSLQFNPDLQRYRALEDVIHQLEIQQGGLKRAADAANVELEKQAKISSELSKYDTSTRDSRNSAIQSLDQQIAQKEAEMEKMLALDKNFQDDYHKLARARTNHESTEEYGQLLEKYNIPEGSGLLQSLQFLAKQRGELQDTIDILKGVKQAVTEVNETASAPSDTSGEDKEQAELAETAQKANEAAEALKKEKEAENQPIALHNQNIDEQLGFYKEFKKVAQEYWDLQGKASDPEYAFSESESKRLDKITPKYEELIKILNQYSVAKARLKNGEVYDFISGDPSDWTAKITQIKDFVFELKNMSQASDQTPVLYEEASGQMPMFEQEAEAKRNDAKATTELAEAEKAASDIPNQITIDEYTERLREEEEQARRTAEAEEKLAEIRNSVYKNQSGGVTSGNYSYDRYDDKNRTLAEKYHGVVYTDEDGNLQSSEKLMVDYDKLLSEILKYDTQIYKVNQDIANAEGNTDGLEKKKRLLDDQLAKYEELIKKVSTDPDYVANRNTAQLSYISEQRDLNRQLLEAETLISKAKSDEAAKQKAINIVTKTQEEAYRKMWEYRTQINLADKNEDASKITNWKNRLQVYKDIRDKATQTLKQLDAQKAKEQELVSLAKIRREIVDKYNDSYAAKQDKKRSEDIATSVQKERAAYKEYWDLRKKYETLDPDNKKNTGDIARLKARAQEQREIYKAEMQNLQALDQDLAKEEALNNVINIRKQTIKEIKDINASKADKDVDAQINNGIAAQKKIGALKGIRYQAEKNPYIDDNDNLFASIDAVISKYQDQIDIANKLISTTEQQKRMNDAVAESNLAYEKAVSKVTEATNKQTEAGKKQDQQLDSTRASLQKQASALTANGKLMKVYGDQVNALLEEIKNPTTTLERLNAIRVELNKISAEATVAGQSGKTLFQILKQRATSLMAYLGTFASFYRIVGYIRSAFSTIKDLDTQLVDLRKTTSMTTSELNQFYMSSSDVAKELGVTTSEIISQAAAWSRLGYSTKEASTEMAKLSSKFASVSPGMTTENATDYLVSTMQAYGIAVDDVERKVMDNVNRIGNTFATTNAEIGEMLTRSSAAMNAANNSLEETIALEASAVEVTRNAEMTGTAFRTVSMRMELNSSPPIW